MYYYKITYIPTRLTDVVNDVDHDYNTKYNMLKSVSSGVAGHFVCVTDGGCTLLCCLMCYLI